MLIKRFLKRFTRKLGVVTVAPTQYLLNPAGLMRSLRKMGRMGEAACPSRLSSIMTIFSINCSA